MCKICESKKKSINVAANEAFYALYFNKPNKKDCNEDFQTHYTISADAGDAYAIIKFCPFCGNKLED